MSACAAQQSGPDNKLATENTDVYKESKEEVSQTDTYSEPEEDTSPIFYENTTIEIIAQDDPFFNYSIPYMTDEQFSEIIDKIVGYDGTEPVQGSDLVNFCDLTGVCVLKEWYSSFYGEEYCTVIQTDRGLQYVVFDGGDLRSFELLNQAKKTTSSKLDSIVVGDHVDKVRSIDLDAEYYDSYGGMGYPPESIHYTSDNMIYHFEYDLGYCVVGVVSMSLDSKSTEEADTMPPEEDNNITVGCYRRINGLGAVYLSVERTENHFELVLKQEERTDRITIEKEYEESFLSTAQLIVGDFNKDQHIDFFVWSLASPNGGTICKIYTQSSDGLELMVDFNEIDLGLTAMPQENYMLLIENETKTASIEINLAEKIDPSINPEVYDEHGKYKKDCSLFFSSIEEYRLIHEDGVYGIWCSRIVEYGGSSRIIYLLQYDTEQCEFSVVELKVEEVPG